MLFEALSGGSRRGGVGLPTAFGGHGIAKSIGGIVLLSGDRGKR
jgi:hypothetical protein